MSIYSSAKVTPESAQLEAEVLKHLQKNKGKKFANADLANEFNETMQSMRNVVERLFRDEKVRIFHDERRRLFYIPTPEQVKALEGNAEAPKPFKVYKLPPEMKKMIDGLHEARAKHPSFYQTNTK